MGWSSGTEDKIMLNKRKPLNSILDTPQLTYAEKVAEKLSDNVINNFLNGMPLEQNQKYMRVKIRQLEKRTNAKTMAKIIDRLNELIKIKGAKL